MPGFNFVTAVLQGVPESLILVFLAYALMGLKVDPMRIVVLALIHLGMLIVIRNLAPFPAHTLFSLAMMPVLLCLWESIPLKAAVIAWGAVMGLLAVFESAALWLFLVGGLPLEMFAVQPWRTIVGLPHVLAMAVLALWIHRRRGVGFFKEILSA